MRKLTVFLIIFIMVLLAAGAILILGWSQDISAQAAASAQFAATDEDQAGVDISSTFRLTFADNVSSASVNKALSVQPEISVGVHQGSSRNEILLVPSEPLAEDTVYSFTLTDAEGRDYSWAVQTRSPVSVVSVEPADRSINIPTDTPLSIVLDQGVEVDLDQAAQHIHITPAREGKFTQQGRRLLFMPDGGWEPGLVYRVEIDKELVFSGSSMALSDSWVSSFETWRQELSGVTFTGKPYYRGGEIPTFGVSQPELDLSLVSAALFRFNDAESYARTLCATSYQSPFWSKNYTFLSGVDITEATALGKQELTPLTSGSGALTSLALSKNPGYGYYLLRINCGGVSRDLLFAVSDITAYMVSDSDTVLLWTYDTASGLPLAAEIADLLGGFSVASGGDGVALIENSGPAVYVIASGDKSLVLPLWDNKAATEEQNTTWRYLYTDKTVYANGEELVFWGALRPRDNTELPYERVSVYIMREGAEEVSGQLWKDYAELNENVFSGSIRLPHLSAGDYELQIWQSGRLYIRSPFRILGAEEQLPAVLPPQPAEAEAEEPVILDMGQSYSVDFSAAGEYLFLTASAGISQAKYSDSPLYTGVFQPGDMLGEQLVALRWNGVGFETAGTRSLLVDHNQDKLHISYNSNAVVNAGSQAEISITVTDAGGQPTPGVNVLLQVLSCEEEPLVDTAAAIFADMNSSGLSLEPDAGRESPASRAGKTWLCQSIVTDEQGRASAQVLMPAGGDAYVIAQAISVQEGGLSAGSAVKKLYYKYDGTTPLELAPNGVIEGGSGHRHKASYSWQSGTVVPGMELTCQGGALFFIDAAHLIYLEKIADAALSPAEGSPAELMARSLARELLSGLANVDLGKILGWETIDSGAHQNSSGGVSAAGGETDLYASALAAFIRPEGMALGDLRDHFRSQLAGGATGLEQAQALAALANCGDTVLAELRYLAAQCRQDETMLWLLLGLLFSGDIRTAEQYYDSFNFSAEESASLTVRALTAARLNRGAESLSLLARAAENGAEAGAETVLAAAWLLAVGSGDQSLSLSYSLDNEARQEEFLVARGMAVAGQELIVKESSDDLCYLLISGKK